MNRHTRAFVQPSAVMMQHTLHIRRERCATHTTVTHPEDRSHMLHHPEGSPRAAKRASRQPTAGCGHTANTTDTPFSLRGGQSMRLGFPLKNVIVYLSHRDERIWHTRKCAEGTTYPAWSTRALHQSFVAPSSRACSVACVSTADPYLPCQRQGAITTLRVAYGREYAGRDALQYPER